MGLALWPGQQWYQGTMLRYYVGILLVTWLPHGVGGCSGRVVMNATSGVITDGPTDYPPSAHCEWLIEAGSSDKFIMLTFGAMKTECSYDYLFIYDGNSFSSPLLGSFSGSSKPNPVLAKSGYMLIYFYSDRNYVLEGFDAKYSVTDCPFNCSGHGVCDTLTHMCQCDSYYTGGDCGVAICLDSCNHPYGSCDLAREKCICEQGYTGYDCRLSTNSSLGQSMWYEVMPAGMGFTPRTGHAGMFTNHLNSLYIFGGNTLNDVLDELVLYDLNSNEWRTVSKTSPWPLGRYHHAITAFGSGFYMYGGLLANGNMSRELWFYDVGANQWTLEASNSLVKPPAVSSHTLTLVEDEWLYLFGGSTKDGQFLSDIHRIHLPEAGQWEVVKSRGGKLADRRLVGHSAVYHKESKSILVFGGFSPDYARFPKRTNYLHSFHINYNYWSQIYHEAISEEDQPKPRAFHSATILDNYMIIYGGNCHIHHEEEICYDDEIHFYHLGCHRWVDHTKMENAFPVPSRQKNVIRRGRFSHVALAAYGNTLLIAGGYCGSVLGDLIAYTVPLGIAKNWNDSRFADDADHCKAHGDYDNCKVDPECVWCMDTQEESVKAGCVHRRHAHTCEKEVGLGSCPGICDSLHDCASCMVQGQGAHIEPSATATLWHNEKCAWCVKEAACQKLEVPKGICNPAEGTPSHMDGWWGKNSSRPTTLEQCRTEDYPAGLHWIRYHNPADYSHPDEVEIVRMTGLTFQFDPVFDSENQQNSRYTSKFQGFIYPLGAPSSNGPPLKVFLVSVAAEAQLYLSTDESKSNIDLVAELKSSQFVTMQAKRPAVGEKVFPHEGPGYKYYMEQYAFQEIAGVKSTQIASNMQLEWTGALLDPTRIRQEFTAEFLEPYNSASCSGYTSCLACMTDTACGWCMTSSVCVMKTDIGASAESCGAVPGAAYLIIQPLECPVCADHISCETCTQDVLCEWLSHEARCLRRGRFDDAVRNVSLCPANCRERANCEMCLSERNECAWCEQTQTCFPFVEYTMTYAYGGCTQWVDSMTEQKCHNCSRYRDCKACLAEFQCGWCGNVNNPTIGTCLHGDFTGPEAGMSCTSLVAEIYNISTTKDADWSYAICPDVHECRLGLHNCHPNATCQNTFDSYECTCNQGFMGNGKDTCNRTCFYDCIHGSCSGAPDYICRCDIGWTGDECNINCGCHNHSTCVTGVGVCDRCQHWTTGKHCQFCRPGSFGDATSDIGCDPCDCNQHGEMWLGYCNSTTGKCSCKHNTEGDHCEHCQEGYYGDPRHGNKCYLRCEGRTIMGNITSGALGSHAGMGVKNLAHAYCLWILTVHPDLNNENLLNPVPTITFTMETDIKTLCSRDYVYVYDGIPSFMTSGSSASTTLLAAYCGYDYTKPISVEAKSGYLTVYFEGNIEPSSSSTRGFNATYHANICPNDCHGNRLCRGMRCVCVDGYGGIDCSINLCPLNCSQDKGQGVCNQELGQCVCSVGFAGPGCDHMMSKRIGVYSSVYDPWRIEGYNAFNSTLARMGHSFVSCDGRAMYMFGGYALNRGILNDLWQFDLHRNSWKQLSPGTEEQPPPRYFHAAVCVPTLHVMFVFGGLLESVGAVHELWKYSLDSGRWSQMEVSGPIPPMAGHTMTLVDSTKIYVVGGFSASNYFTEHVYEYDTSNNRWRELDLSGSQPTGVYGHTSVYHAASHSVYVFGGYEYQTDKSTASSNLYSIDLSERVWSLLPAEQGNRPSERLFHAAVSTENYMVVMGGKTHQDDFDSTAWAYRYSCNHWTDVTTSAVVIGDGIQAVIGPAAIAKSSNYEEEIFFVAGFNGISHGSLMKLTLPKDLCNLYQEELTCSATLGCAACVDEDTNITYCYTNNDQDRFDCAHGSTWRYVPGVVCDKQRIEQRDCNQHRGCTECLADWPSQPGHGQACQWCSNCPAGRCIRINTNCQEVNKCDRQQRTIAAQNACVERLCQAADCDKCSKLGNCIWTRQFKRSSEVGRTLSLIPIYDWNCVVKSLLDATPYSVQSSPPSACPVRCYQFTGCKSCIKSVGGEGGSQGCVWSVRLQECMPPAYMPLHCSNGECGLILAGQADQCPQNCSIHDQCSSCLATPGCGWCAFGGLNGLGVCIEGGLSGPQFGQCDQHNVTLGRELLPLRVYNWTLQATGPPIWSFGQCLPENECLNGHHNCDASENCTDLAIGFRCDCKLGYARDSNRKCRPHCNQHCNHGDCIAPDICKCHFGYVGHNCSTECQCNKHSNCKSVSERKTCLKCHNNTKGDQCQECEPWYVGNPHNGGRCKSCWEFCNRHSNMCLSHDQYRLVIAVGNVPKLNNLSMIDHGPRDEDNAMCIGCHDNVQGDRCHKCKNGYFRLNLKTKADPCRKCECHGHSDICDKDSGINCDCKNNTKSKRCEDTQDNKNPCYTLQCSECIDNFLGTPTKGHQCYRQMTVDRDYCFDPATQMHCNMQPGPLYWGRSVFFAVQPKYLNVDIRITLDVTSGGVDVYFSPLSDTYAMTIDPLTGIHSVNIDGKFNYKEGNHANIRPTREAGEENANDVDPRDERAIPGGNVTDDDSPTTYTLETIPANNFNTFIKLMDQDIFLHVRNVRHRLVLTLPNDVHRLKVSRFYLVLLGTGSPTHNETYGNLFFRQDQPHIDLFVFFSVFFSCFFLFLAKCVVLWKLKQALDAQRSRHRQRLEMQHMASRPFSRVNVVIDPDTSEVVQLMTTSTPLPRKTTIPKLYSKYSINSDSYEMPGSDDKLYLRPLALEPTDDGIAAVGTFFFQLPGSNSCSVHACLGSCLIQSSRVYLPTPHYHQPKSVYIRRQPSSSA